MKMNRVNVLKKAVQNHFMQNAVKPSHKGLFTKKAKAAGKSVSEYAEEKKSAKGKLGKEARLALVLEHAAKRKK